MPTRGRLGNRSNILDLIFTNEEGMIENVKYESPLGKRDHAVLLINHIMLYRSNKLYQT